MKPWSIFMIAAACTQTGFSEAGQTCPELLDFSVRKLDSRDEVRLCDAYRNKVLLVVNTASRCAFTGQYEDLEALYRDKREQGLVVLGFPSNDFGKQEPGGEKSIRDFCKLTYDVSFPMFAKVHVKGERIHPFYQALVEQSGSRPKWNFHKYLIGRDGQLIDSYWSMTAPDSKRLRRAIDRALR